MGKLGVVRYDNKVALLFAMVLFFCAQQARGQDLIRGCLPENGRGNGLAVQIDPAGMIHMAHASQLQGTLRYTTMAVDGTAVSTTIANRIHRFPTTETLATGIALDGSRVLICFHNQLARTMNIAIGDNGSWTTERLASNVTGDGCAVGVANDETFVAYQANGQLRGVRRVGNGGWVTTTIDPGDGDVGALPSLLRNASEQWVVAYRDTGNGRLKIATASNGAWDIAAPEMPLANAGYDPKIVETPDGMSVFHGNLVGEVDIESDGSLIVTTLSADGSFSSSVFADFAVGGTIGAATSDRGTFVATRHLLRSALFGDADGLLVYSGTPLQSQAFEQYGPAQGRHTYLYVRATTGPFGMPFIAFVDSFIGGFGNQDGSPICYWRPRDTDQDLIPDEVEQELGTDPQNPDTDADGRTDGQEVLIDGTNPLADDVCRPLPEVCNGDDDDCDGTVDENLVTACYEGAAGSEDVGLCVAGERRCRDGAWLSCEGQVTPTEESCDLRDEDCDGRVDEDVPGEGAPCDTGNSGICADGVLSCFAGAIRCAALTERQVEVCNGLDDDCDGTVDEGEISCGDGLCVRTVPACSGGLDNVCRPLPPVGPDDTCNGDDEDCDGVTDEAVLAQDVECGRGACARAGQLVCSEGALVSTCEVGSPSADTTCDGLDDDCDGRVDEAYLEQANTCGVGACRAQGVTTCVNGQEAPECTPLPPAVGDAVCDGVDSDCDGRVDEGFQEQASVCGSGACASAGVVRCQNGQLVDSCEVDPGRPDTVCDGIDSDCDGRVDEAYVAAEIQCGVGLCRAAGVTVCDDGAVVERCEPFPPAADNTCNGLDEDCDGLSDEGAEPFAVECGVGACLTNGVRTCRDGDWATDCQPGQPQPDSNCDGIDDDCDGANDEAFIVADTACGEGRCARTGQTSCQQGVVVDSCEAAPPEVLDWVCDGADEDCDGRIDEDFQPEDVSCGVGACRNNGLVQCVNGARQTICEPLAPGVDDACNGIDEDCDGVEDEGFVGLPVSCGSGACEKDVTSRCVDGQVDVSCTPGQPLDGDVDCDGLDTDCDGRVDEGFVPEQGSCGLGACRSDGVWSCVDGRRQLTCEEGLPVADVTCDGLDQDCDGRIDEGFVGAAVVCGVGACAANGQEVCRGGSVVNTCVPGAGEADDLACDGVDQDCDGRVDEDYVATAIECGVGACRAQGTVECRQGVEVDICTPAQASPDDVLCDGIDSDCDGELDEDYASVDIECGVGVCRSAGLRRCRDGVVQELCVPLEPAGADGNCDGRDQDCDGSSDEGFVGGPSICGVGACLTVGQFACVDGRVVDECSASEPQTDRDTCDGIDDDCDGRIDEDHQAERTVCGAGACVAFGRLNCVNGQTVDSCVPTEPKDDDENCDGNDGDCDGRVDEAFDVTETACGVGACGALGQLRCIDGRIDDTCRPNEAVDGPDICDGIDSDCDGRTDEEHRVTRSWCSTGVCLSSGRIRCTDGAIVDTCIPREPWGRDSTCDGIDADCDGRYDERYRQIDTSCGLGVCAATGQTSCEDGVVADSCQPAEPTGDDTDCNGLDDDCDGRVDEAFVSAVTNCGIGFCARTGQTTCNDGVLTDSCAPGEPRGRDSACDGIDADCDGRVDERFRESVQQCGLGVCASEGLVSCVDGRVVNGCSPGEPTGVDAICDGLDEDCDGIVDESYQASNTRCGEGVCMETGTRRCEGGQLVDSCVPGPPSGPDNSCDGLDNDCDGVADEDVPQTPSNCGAGACRNSGFFACVGGRLQDNCRPLIPAVDDSVCDGLDNDCNGTVDEDFRPAQIQCGVGACQRNGITQCFGGELLENCRPGSPAPGDIDCDGQDDDCDGRNDEDFQGQPIECGVGVCAVSATASCSGGELRAECEPLAPAGDDEDCDGLDSDCDGRVDEGSLKEVECGIGLCRRVGRQFCRNGGLATDCTPGEPDADDATCDGQDDDCDGTADENCLVDSRVVTVTDGAIADVSLMDLGDAALSPVDSEFPDERAVDANSARRDMSSSVNNADAETSSTIGDGAVLDGFNCLGDGSCDGVEGLEARRPIRSGCDCAASSTHTSVDFLFYFS